MARGGLGSGRVLDCEIRFEGRRLWNKSRVRPHRIPSGPSGTPGAGLESKLLGAARKSPGIAAGVSLLKPVVAEGEEEAGVEAGIQMAEAGVGMMDELDFEIPGAARPREEMEAERAL